MEYLHKSVIFQFLLIIVLISGCGDGKNDVVNVDSLCANAVGLSYAKLLLSQKTVGNAGIVSNIHDELTILDHAQMKFYGTTLEGTYSYQCIGHTITVDATEGPLQIELSENLDSLTLNSDSESISYQLLESAGNVIDCDRLYGRQYTLTEQIKPINQALFSSLQFNSKHSASYTSTDNTTHSGFVDCTTGQMHVHSSLDDINPAIIKRIGEGFDVKVTLDGVSFFMPEVGGLSFCSKEYQPVCSADTQITYVAEVGPFAAGMYRTEANRCTSESKELEVIFEGECGDKEGQPHLNKSKDCSNEPIKKQCIAVRDAAPCEGIPCPKLLHKTTTSQCETRQMDGFTIIPDQACGDMEGEETEDKFIINCHGSTISNCAKTYSLENCGSHECKKYFYESRSQLPCYFDRSRVAIYNSCGNLVNIEANPYLPLVVFSSPLSDSSLQDKNVSVITSKFEDSTLQVNISYVGCKAQQFNIMIGLEFDKQPPVAHAYFSPFQLDDCLEPQSSELIFDTAPLKEIIRQKLGSGVTGSIDLGDLGTFHY